MGKLCYKIIRKIYDEYDQVELVEFWIRKVPVVKTNVSDDSVLEVKIPMLSCEK